MKYKIMADYTKIFVYYILILLYAKIDRQCQATQLISMEQAPMAGELMMPIDSKFGSLAVHKQLDDMFGKLKNWAKQSPNSTELIQILDYLEDFYAKLIKEKAQGKIWECGSLDDPVHMMCEHLENSIPCSCDPELYRKNKKLRITCDGLNHRYVLRRFNQIHLSFSRIIKVCNCTPSGAIQLVLKRLAKDTPLIQCINRRVLPRGQVENDPSFEVPLDVQVCFDYIVQLCIQLNPHRPCTCQLIKSTFPPLFSMICHTAESTSQLSLEHDIEFVRMAYYRTLTRYHTALKFYSFNVTIMVGKIRKTTYLTTFTKTMGQNLLEQVNQRTFELSMYEKWELEIIPYYPVDYHYNCTTPMTRAITTTQGVGVTTKKGLHEYPTTTPLEITTESVITEVNGTGSHGSMVITLSTVSYAGSLDEISPSLSSNIATATPSELTLSHDTKQTSPTVIPNTGSPITSTLSTNILINVSASEGTPSLTTTSVTGSKETTTFVSTLSILTASTSGELITQTKTSPTKSTTASYSDTTSYKPGIVTSRPVTSKGTGNTSEETMSTSSTISLESTLTTTPKSRVNKNTSSLTTELFESTSGAATGNISFSASTGTGEYKTGSVLGISKVANGSTLRHSHLTSTIERSPSSTVSGSTETTIQGQANITESIETESPSTILSRTKSTISKGTNTASYSGSMSSGLHVSTTSPFTPSPVTTETSSGGFSLKTSPKSHSITQSISLSSESPGLNEITPSTTLINGNVTVSIAEKPVSGSPSPTASKSMETYVTSSIKSSLVTTSHFSGETSSVTSSPTGTGQEKTKSTKTSSNAEISSVKSSPTGTRQEKTKSTKISSSGETSSVTSSPTGTGQEKTKSTKTSSSGETSSVTSSPTGTGQEKTKSTKTSSSGETSSVTSSPTGTGQEKTKSTKKSSSGETSSVTSSPTGTSKVRSSTKTPSSGETSSVTASPTGTGSEENVSSIITSSPIGTGHVKITSTKTTLSGETSIVTSSPTGTGGVKTKSSTKTPSSGETASVTASPSGTGSEEIVSSIITSSPTGTGHVKITSTKTPFSGETSIVTSSPTGTGRVKTKSSTKTPSSGETSSVTASPTETASEEMVSPTGTGRVKTKSSTKTPSSGETSIVTSSPTETGGVKTKSSTKTPSSGETSSVTASPTGTGSEEIVSSIITSSPNGTGHVKITSTKTTLSGETSIVTSSPTGTGGVKTKSSTKTPSSGETSSVTASPTETASEEIVSPTGTGRVKIKSSTKTLSSGETSSVTTSPTVTTSEEIVSPTGTGRIKIKSSTKTTSNGETSSVTASPTGTGRVKIKTSTKTPASGETSSVTSSPTGTGGVKIKTSTKTQASGETSSVTSSPTGTGRVKIKTSTKTPASGETTSVTASPTGTASQEIVSPTGTGRVKIKSSTKTPSSGETSTVTSSPTGTGRVKIESSTKTPASRQTSSVTSSPTGTASEEIVSPTGTGHVIKSSTKTPSSVETSSMTSSPTGTGGVKTKTSTKTPASGETSSVTASPTGTASEEMVSPTGTGRVKTKFSTKTPSSGETSSVTSSPTGTGRVKTTKTPSSGETSSVTSSPTGTGSEKFFGGRSSTPILIGVTSSGLSSSIGLEEVNTTNSATASLATANFTETVSEEIVSQTTTYLPYTASPGRQKNITETSTELTKTTKSRCTPVICINTCLNGFKRDQHNCPTCKCKPPNLCDPECGLECPLGYKYDKVKKCQACECLDNQTVVGVCEKKIFKECVCDMHKLLVENQIQLVCTITQIRIFVVTVNMLVDEITNIINFHNLNGIWTVSIIIQNGLSITGGLLVDCESLTPYPLVRNMDGTSILFIPLGRDICEDPIFIMCTKLDAEQPCRCNRDGYRPPILSIICSGNNFTRMIMGFYEVRNKILQVFITKKLLDCAITTIQLTFEDKTVEKSMAFIDCDTKKMLKLRAGPSRETIIAFPLRTSLCQVNDSSLADLCNKHAKDFPCKCTSKMQEGTQRINIQCMGKSTEVILKEYNKLQKLFRTVVGWDVKFETTVTTVTFPEITEIIPPMGFCQNSTTFQEVVKDSKLALVAPIGIDACPRSIKSICELYAYKPPCKCDVKALEKDKQISFDCKGANITSILDTYNVAQTELEKVQVSTEFQDINVTTWAIYNTTEIDVELGDCDSMKKLKPIISSERVQKWKVPVGTLACPTNTKGFCTVYKDRAPCRCEMVNDGGALAPTFVCQGMSLNDLLRDYNVLRKNLAKINTKSRDLTKFVKVVLSDFRALPDIYDCDSRVKQYREMEVNNIYTALNSSVCTKDMLQSGNFYGPELKAPLSRIDYFKSGLLRSSYKIKRRYQREKRESEPLESNGGGKEGFQHYLVSRNVLIIGASALIGFMCLLLGVILLIVVSTVLVVVLYMKKKNRSTLSSNGLTTYYHPELEFGSGPAPKPVPQTYAQHMFRSSDGPTVRSEQFSLSDLRREFS